MPDIEEIPTPDRSGSNGDQKADLVGHSLVEMAPFSGIAMASTLEGIAADGSRSFGGPVVQKIVIAVTRTLENQNAALQMENRRLTGTIDQLRNDLQEVRIEKAVLTTTIESDRAAKNLRNFCIAIGTGMLTFSINLVRTASSDAERQMGVVLGVLGALMLGWAWYSSSQGVKK